MKYKILIADQTWYFFKYKKFDSFYGERYLCKGAYGSVEIVEEEVFGLNDGAVFISNRAMFKLAVLNNFLDKLKEMCSTDLNTKQ